MQNRNGRVHRGEDQVVASERGDAADEAAAGVDPVAEEHVARNLTDGAHLPLVTGPRSVLRGEAVEREIPGMVLQNICNFQAGVVGVPGEGTEADPGQWAPPASSEE